MLPVWEYVPLSTAVAKMLPAATLTSASGSNYSFIADYINIIFILLNKIPTAVSSYMFE
jgi:hypothetical protein